MSDLRGYRHKVESILRDHEKARNNDGVLYAHFINKYCGNLISLNQNGEKSIALKDFYRLPPMENIRRSRQIIQNDHNMYLPTDPAVLKARKIKEANIRSEIAADMV